LRPKEVQRIEKPGHPAERRRAMLRSLKKILVLFLVFTLVISAPAITFSIVGVPQISVKVTAYAPIARLCDSTPNITASGLRLKPHHYWKVVALSNDLAKGCRFGDRFKLVISGKEYIVVYEDRMAPRMRKTVDLLLPSYNEARRFGVRHGVLMPLDD
jgi:3D (Asp-Asp-Asp) domain-containing protein